MAKTKQSPARKPVKARGALPSPRVAPQRDTTPWHKKTAFRVLLAILFLILLAVAVKLILDARQRAEGKRRDVRAIEQFERKIQELNLNLQPVYQAIGEAPGAFLAGALPEAEYRTLAEGWVEKFRDLNQGIRNLRVPTHLEDLQESKASYVQATTIYIDAAKIFVTAADIDDPAARESATVLARNTLLHASAVSGMGDRAITRIKNEYDLNDPPASLPPPEMPLEDIPAPPPQPPPGSVEQPSTVAPQGEPAPSPAAAP